jgi:DNA (cytosine-5)-methyltransferase 1
MRYVDLFCGAGGASCGLTRAGWENVGAVDWDERALAVYARNFPTHPVHRLDLSERLPDSLVETWKGTDVVWASSPCTDFSTANGGDKRRTDRSSLTATLAQHVLDLAPDWVCFENVPRARTQPEFAHLVDTLAAAGYRGASAVVHAVHAGLPQTRKRLFFVATRLALDPEAVLRRFTASLTSSRPRTMRECFVDAGVACPTDFIYLPSCDERRRKSVFTLDGPGPTIRGYLRPFRTTYPFPPRDDTHDPHQVFAATPAHTAALQGFPPTFVWTGISKTAAARAIGNAVPPPLAHLLARAITPCPESPGS